MRGISIQEDAKEQLVQRNFPDAAGVRKSPGAMCFPPLKRGEHRGVVYPPASSGPYLSSCERFLVS